MLSVHYVLLNFHYSYTVHAMQFSIFRYHFFVVYSLSTIIFVYTYCMGSPCRLQVKHLYACLWYDFQRFFFVQPLSHFCGFFQLSTGLTPPLLSHKPHVHVITLFGENPVCVGLIRQSPTVLCHITLFTSRDSRKCFTSFLMCQVNFKNFLLLIFELCVILLLT